MGFQIADITRPLLSVGKICDQNNQIIFGKGGGVIVDLDTGNTRNFIRDSDGMYQLDFWVKKEIANGNPKQDFPGRGQ